MDFSIQCIFEFLPSLYRESNDNYGNQKGIITVILLWKTLLTEINCGKRQNILVQKKQNLLFLSPW